MGNSYYYINEFENLRDKFYSRKHFSKNFDEISEERLIEIKEMAKNWRNIQLSNPNKQGYDEKLNLYRTTLYFLLNPHTNAKLKSFDEKMVFFINVIDPEHLVAKRYIEAPLLTPYERKYHDKINIEDKQKNDDLLKNLSRSVQNDFSFTDQRFINLELIYFQKRELDKELIDNINSNYLKDLLQYTPLLRSFNRLSDEEFNRLNEIAQSYIATTENTNINKIAYHLLKQSKLLKINGTITELFTLFILIADPNLNLLKIYYDESMFPKMEERANNELGFYNKDLIRIEELFRQRFMPDVLVSEWQQKKN